jgi:3-oxoacyl-[acyl-carrier protein] reductase
VLLKGKNAVITGCLKSIGRATMELFAKNGANIWACCQYQDIHFDDCMDNLKRMYDVRIRPLFFDLMEYEQIKAGVKTIMSTKEPVDVLVNVAGMTQDALFHMISMEQMKHVFEVNFFSQRLLTQYITRLMLRHKSGSVINISSI